MDGTPCRNWAGHRTPHQGTGPCYKHEGQTKSEGANGNFTKKMFLDFVEQERQLGVYGNPVDIDPHTALLQEVQRTAGHVEWLRQIIDDIHNQHAQSGDSNALDRTLVQFTPMGIAPSVWIDMYKEERKHLLRACEVAIKAGVAERAVQIAQDQARTLAMILKMFLLDNRMNFTPEQRIHAPQVIRELIQQVPNQVHLDALPAASWDTDTEPEPEPEPAPKTRTRKKAKS